MEDARLSARAKLMPMIKRFARMALLLIGLVAEANSQAGAVPGAEWRQLATPERAGWSATGWRRYVGMSKRWARPGRWSCGKAWWLPHGETSGTGPICTPALRAY